MDTPNWDNINIQKRNDISWMNAKNNAVAIVVGNLRAGATPEEIQLDITFWTNWIYSLEPTTLKKQYPKGRVSAPQRDYLKSLYLQKENKEFGEEYYENMGALTASKEITRLKAMPTVNTGDGDFRDDYQGDKVEGQLEREQRIINANK